MLKYNKSKIEAMLGEEAGRRRDRGPNYRVHINHPSVTSSPLPIGGVLHNQ